MKKKKLSFLAFFIVLTFVLGSCTDNNSQVTSQNTSIITTTALVTSETSKTTLAALVSEEETVTKKEATPLTVALNKYSTVCNPFYINGETEEFLNEITGVRLLERDRDGRIITDGIKGEKRAYNRTVYEYSGISGVTETYNEELNETISDFTLRNNVKFSDGENLDADDLIFTLYVLLDPSFSNISSIQGTGIKGEINYRLNSTIADTLTQEEIAEALLTEEVAKKIRNKIVVPTLKSEFEWVKSLYDDTTYSVYTEAYPEAKDLMAFFYSVDSEYNSKAVASEEKVLSDLADMYGGNYELLGSMAEGDSSFYKADAYVCAIDYLSEQSGENAPVMSISGIQKTGKYSVRITATGNNPSLIYELGDIIVAPLHYYGNESNFNIQASRFGFEKGKALELIKEKESTPLGAGAYSYERSESGVVYLTANPHYYKGVPLTEKIEVKLATADKAVSAVTEGTADISYPDGSLKAYEEIDAANEALEKLSASSISKNGYGYIGINTRTVNIGGVPDSEESVALRKALATAIYYYRDLSVSKYYGDGGIVTDYPASLKVWLGTEYEKPYSVNASGEAIYPDDMTDLQRYNAVKAACLSFFEAAGYTVSDSLVISAPEGGTVNFQAIIAAGGTGNHPSYYALTAGSRLLGEIGITLNVTDTADASQMWSVVNSGTHQIWAAVWETGVQPRLSTMYSDDNLYGIYDERLSECMVISENSKDNEELKAAYGDCLNILFSKYAVEIPVYQRSSSVLFSTLRIDTGSLPQDMTGYYSWVNEIHLITKK